MGVQALLGLVILLTFYPNAIILGIVAGLAGPILGVVIDAAVRHTDRVHLEGRTPPDEWQDLQAYQDEYDHPLWKELGDQAEGKGHGGMDYMELYRLTKALREGIPTDWNVYDAASWSVLFELTERSVANKSRPVDFPDFTRGGWKTGTPLGIVTA